MKDLIIRLNTSKSLQTSNEDVKILKYTSSISPENFIKTLKFADNKVNPRIASVNKITKAIHETLETSPELFWLKSKGILIATENCEELQRNRIRISFDNPDYEGIMDGGHNTFAIATYIIHKLYGKKIKKWDECKTFWEDNYDDILKKFSENKNLFQFSIPVEIITPSDEEGALLEFYDNISEICAARNNNVQLKETAKGNQVGSYDYLKNVLSDFDIVWKTGEKGTIKSEDIISLACLPLIFLKNNNSLPQDINSLNKMNIYSNKGKCVDFFNSVIAHKDVSYEENGKYIIKNQKVISALELTKDLLFFFDKLFISFPSLYHSAAPGKFGRISSVENKQVRVPFYTMQDISDYQYSFGFFYPLIAGTTSLIKLNSNSVKWKESPLSIDLNTLSLTQYVELIKMVNWDPQKIGKGSAFYNEAETVFERYLLA